MRFYQHRVSGGAGGRIFFSLAQSAPGALVSAADSRCAYDPAALARGGAGGRIFFSLAQSAPGALLLVFGGGLALMRMILPRSRAAELVDGFSSRLRKAPPALCC